MFLVFCIFFGCVKRRCRQHFNSTRAGLRERVCVRVRVFVCDAGFYWYLFYMLYKQKRTRRRRSSRRARATVLVQCRVRENSQMGG